MARQRSLARDLTMALSLAILVVTATLMAWGYVESVRPLDRQLRWRAASWCRTISRAIEKDLWNLDSDAMHAYFRRAPHSPDLAWVRVLTEYGEPVSTLELNRSEDVVLERTEVFHGGRSIGAVEVAFGRESIRRFYWDMARQAGLTASLAVLTLMLLTSLFMRRLQTRPLHGLTEGLRTIAGGDYAHRLPDSPFLELAPIHREVNAMAAQIADRTAQLESEIAERKRVQAELEQLRDHLEDLVRQRTAELDHSHALLRQQIEKRRQVQEEIVAVGHREQQRIGRDLHDTLGQHLAATAFMGESLAKHLTDESRPEAETARKIVALLREAVALTRRIARGLTPAAVAQHGLADALDHLARDTEKVFGVNCTFTSTGDGRLDDDTVAAHLYYIAQEAVHNALRHGRAKQVRIALRIAPNDGFLSIQDDGVGIPSEPHATEGLGTRTMRYRAEMVHGELLVVRNELGGTTVQTAFEHGPHTNAAS
jgi:signal transduction histidine kinase